MRVVLTGTGSVDGLPVPGCCCARCRAAARTGEIRTPAAAVVDGVLRLGDGPVGPVPDGYTVTPVDSGTFSVRTPGGSLLWAPRRTAAASLPAGVTYDVVGLGAADGEVSAPAVGHVLGTLRAAGVVGRDTVVIAVGIGHEAPLGAELRRRLASWDVRVVGDGAVIESPAPATRAVPETGWRTLVLGGARSGKSVEAERLLAAEPAVTYVATASGRADAGPDDEDWAARIRAHRDRRPEGWSTVETLELRSLLDTAPGALLIDCLSLWLAGVMDGAGVWAGRSGADDALAAAIDTLVRAWRGAPGRVVAVSSEVGSGIVPDTVSGRRFRDELGRLNQRIAAESDEVLLVVAGQAVRLGDRP